MANTKWFGPHGAQAPVAGINILPIILIIILLIIIHIVFPIKAPAAGRWAMLKSKKVLEDLEDALRREGPIIIIIIVVVIIMCITISSSSRSSTSTSTSLVIIVTTNKYIPIVAYYITVCHIML